MINTVLETTIGEIRMTVEEFAGSDYARGFELVEGVVVPRGTSRNGFLKKQKYMPTGILHGIVTGRLTAYLAIHVIENDLGEICAAETGFRVSNLSVRGSNVAFIKKENLQTFGIPINFFPVAPDLAVEVISPNNTYDEIQDKIEKYLSGGTKLVWIVDPKRSHIFVHRPDKTVTLLSGDDILEGEGVIQNFRCPLEKIFGNLLEVTE